MPTVSVVEAVRIPAYYGVYSVNFPIRRDSFAQFGDNHV